MPATPPQIVPAQSQELDPILGPTDILSLIFSEADGFVDDKTREFCVPIQRLPSTLAAVNMFCARYDGSRALQPALNNIWSGNFSYINNVGYVTVGELDNLLTSGTISTSHVVGAAAVQETAAHYCTHEDSLRESRQCVERLEQSIDALTQARDEALSQATTAEAESKKIQVSCTTSYRDLLYLIA